MDAPLNIGDRVGYGERRGSVRFLGSLESVGKAGDWVGVEWDEEQPGLHDGVLNGIRFFHARPFSASFVPLRKIERGISIVRALEEKYGAPADTDVGVRFGTKDVIAVGWEKIMKKVSNFERLVHIDVTGFIVNAADPDLGSVIPNVQTLVLGKSLISSWSSVMRLIAPLVRLNTLDLTHSRITMDATERNLAVKKLILIKNELTWKDVSLLFPVFPCLQELHLAENCVQQIEEPPLNMISQLSLLDLDSQRGNLLDWHQVCNLGRIASLTSLQLSGNHMKEIEFDSEPQATKTLLFPSLTQLIIRSNEISSWSSVNSLNQLECLENLKIMSNPFLESMNPATARQWIIAKISGLKVLNQTPVTPRERQDSEIDYMRHFAPEWLKISKAVPVDDFRKKAFLEEHPRFPEFVEKFGPLEESEEKPDGDNKLKTSLVKVTLQYHDKKQAKSIPLTITVMRLKQFVERIFRIEEAQKLAYITPSKPGATFVLDDDQKEIAHYDLKSGDTVLVNS